MILAQYTGGEAAPFLVHRIHSLCNHPLRVAERCRRSIARINDRIDVAAPASSGEDAGMADAGLEMVTLYVGSDAGAQFLRRQCLADAADIISRFPSTVKNAVRRIAPASIRRPRHSNLPIGSECS